MLFIGESNDQRKFTDSKPYIPITISVTPFHLHAQYKKSHQIILCAMIEHNRKNIFLKSFIFSST